MRKTIILLLLCIVNMAVFAQSMRIVDFYLNEHDQTANDERTKEIDDNGKVAALIRIETTQKGFLFEGGTVGIVKTDDNHPGEIWLYVPAGLSRLSIFHSTFGVIRDYPFPIALMPARTYVMTLVTDGAAPIPGGGGSPSSQYIDITVTPKEAMVEIDDEIVPISNGKGNKLVSLGKHTYRAQLTDYHTVSGRVDVSDPDHKTPLNINMKPAFGYLNVTGNSDMYGARVYVGSEYAGTVPLSNYRVANGHVKVRISKEMYKEQSQYEDFNDGNVVNITASLQPKFSTVTLEGDNGDSIFVNNTFKGIGTWTGKLEYGDYVFRTSRRGHRPGYQNMKITPAVGGKFNLPKPTPIYGSVNVNVTPTGSQIYMDGSNTQESTPSLFNKVLTGTHRIVVKYNGYDDLDTTIVVSEGKITTLSCRLKEVTRCDMSISPRNLYFSKSKGSEDVKVSGPCDWNLDQSSIPYWMTAKVSGEKIMVSVEKNKTYSTRNANLLLNYQNGTSGQISVNQGCRTRRSKPTYSKPSYSRPTYSAPRYAAYDNFTDKYGVCDITLFTAGVGIGSAINVDLAAFTFRTGPVSFEWATFSFLMPWTQSIYDSFKCDINYEPKILFHLPTHATGSFVLGGGIALKINDSVNLNPLAQIAYRLYLGATSYDFYFRYNGYFQVGLTMNLGVLPI